MFCTLIFNSIVEFFGLSEGELPSVRLINIADEMAKYKPEGDVISTEVLAKFAEDYLSGSLKVCHPNLGFFFSALIGIKYFKTAQRNNNQLCAHLAATPDV
jgi:hypothetical protein